MSHSNAHDRSERMTQDTPRGVVSVVALLLTGLPLLSRVVYAEDVRVEGVIKGRSGNSLVLQTSDSLKVIVLLTDSTDVGQLQGALKARNKKMSMAALFPGLPIRATGSHA